MAYSRTTQAVFLQDSFTKPPMLSPGEISPETLAAWEYGARGWIAYKKVKVKDQVRLVTFGFRDPLIRDWLHLNALTHNALSFSDFMTEFRANWLEHGWESKLFNALLNSRQGLGSFWDWQLNLQYKNALLATTPSYLDENALRRKLESGVNAELASHLGREDFSTLSFTEWIASVRLLDQARMDHAARVSREVAKLRRRAEPRTNSARGARTSYTPGSTPRPAVQGQMG